MKKALQAMVNKHFSTIAFDLPVPSKQVLDVIVESSNGDIRSAINTLEFACTIELPNKKRKGVTAGTTIVLEAVTRREQSLALFHLIGKVLYNKRTPYLASLSIIQANSGYYVQEKAIPQARPPPLKTYRKIVK
jgi:cell cycle checkpoint protein